jgi:hypothetical protein
MRFWVREVAGWALVGLGFYPFFYLAYDFCLSRRIFEAWVVAIIGIFVFRGGIHLLKVAVAARVCQQAQEQPAPHARAQPPRSQNAPGAAPRPLRRTVGG